MRPDYAGGSLVNLIATLVAARGGKALHEPLRDFTLDSRVRNVVLVIIDGLGDKYLARRGAGSELLRRRRLRERRAALPQPRRHGVAQRARCRCAAHLRYAAAV